MQGDGLASSAFAVSGGRNAHPAAELPAKITLVLEADLLRNFPHRLFRSAAQQETRLLDPAFGGIFNRTRAVQLLEPPDKVAFAYAGQLRQLPDRQRTLEAPVDIPFGGGEIHPFDAARRLLQAPDKLRRHFGEQSLAAKLTKRPLRSFLRNLCTQIPHIGIRRCWVKTALRFLAPCRS